MVLKNVKCSKKCSRLKPLTISGIISKRKLQSISFTPFATFFSEVSKSQALKKRKYIYCSNNTKLAFREAILSKTVFLVNKTGRCGLFHTSPFAFFLFSKQAHDEFYGIAKETGDFCHEFFAKNGPEHLKNLCENFVDHFHCLHLAFFF